MIFNIHYLWLALFFSTVSVVLTSYSMMHTPKMNKFKRLAFYMVGMVGGAGLAISLGTLVNQLVFK
jgi:hypothetical protein